MKHVFSIISRFLLTKLCWFCQKRLLFTGKHLDIRVTRKFVLMKIQKQGFQTWKNSIKPHKYKNVLQKKFPEGFRIKTIDPIRFMKMLWLISANWWFKKNIGSGMAFGWCDTPQCRALQCSIFIEAVQCTTTAGRLDVHAPWPVDSLPRGPLHHGGDPLHHDLLCRPLSNTLASEFSASTVGQYSILAS